MSYDAFQKSSGRVTLQQVAFRESRFSKSSMGNAAGDGEYLQPTKRNGGIIHGQMALL